MRDGIRVHVGKDVVSRLIGWEDRVAWGGVPPPPFLPLQGTRPLNGNIFMVWKVQPFIAHSISVWWLVHLAR